MTERVSEEEADLACASAHNYSLAKEIISRLLAELNELEAKLEAVKIAHRNLSRDFAEARRAFAREALIKLDENAISVDRAKDGTYTTRIKMHLEGWLRAIAEGK